MSSVRSVPLRLFGSRVSAATLLTLSVISSACRQAPKYSDADLDYFRGAPHRIAEAYSDALTDLGRDGLVGRMKLLSAALLVPDWIRAETLALRVSTEVNTYLAGEGGEQDALSSFGREADKPFKGEPHERVMADFYLGLLRYRRGDIEGALAAFRSAANHDRGWYEIPRADGARRGRVTADRWIYDSDFIALEFFIARSWLLLGEIEEAERSFERAIAAQPELEPFLRKALDLENDLIVVLEAGRAPTKRRTGPGGAILGYSSAPRVDVTAVRWKGVPLEFAELDDLYGQATTLGRRAVDDLNRSKAERQETVRAVGTGAAVTGAVLALQRNRRVRSAGLIALLAGLGALAFAESAYDPEADVRAWTMLPGTILLAVGKSGGGTGVIELETTGRPPPPSTWASPGERSDLIAWIRVLPRSIPWAKRTRATRFPRRHRTPPARLRPAFVLASSRSRLTRSPPLETRGSDP
jgi:tetratricopeptide (TPR) repeat protein